MNELELRIRRFDWDLLHRTLFPGDGDEHGAAVLCGSARSKGSNRLVARQVVPAVDGIDYVPGVRGYRHLTGAFVTRQLRTAKDLGLVYLAAHNHGGRGPVGFSRSDLASHERAYPTLLNVSGNPVGGLVLSCDALAGDVWMPDGARCSIKISTIIGDGLLRITPNGAFDRSGERRPPDEETYTRQSLIFGRTGQEILGSLKVGVVGAGGVGMLTIQALARLGVGAFVVIDPDVVSASNLSRLPEARSEDAFGFLGDSAAGRIARRLGFGGPTSKVTLAKRIIGGANPQARMTMLRADVADEAAARELCDCDFIFLAADTMLARDVVNQISYQYLIPTLQVGSKVTINKKTGDVSDVYAVVRSLGTAPGCLRCNGLVNMSQLTEESVGTDEQRMNQRYVDDPQIEAPSVITLNSLGVGWAVNDFMQYATGLGRPSDGYRLLRSRPVASSSQQLTLQRPAQDPDCHVCGLGTFSALSRGDAMELPTRIARAA